MSLDPRHFLARPLAALAAVLCLLAATACTPEPAEVDESPVAGMTEENPSDDEILGESIAVEAATEARLDISGTPMVEGAAEVTCSVTEYPEVHGSGGHGGAAAHGSEAADDHGTADSGAEHVQVAQAGLAGDHGEDHADADTQGGHMAEDPDAGEGDHGGGGGHASFTETARFAFSPPGDSPIRLVVEVPAYHGEGDYDATFRLEAMDENGDYVESIGTGTARLEKGTLLSSSAATHWIGGTFDGEYTGEAGTGDVNGAVERCYYFK